MLKQFLLVGVKFFSSQDFVKKEINPNARKIISLYTKKGFIKEFVTLRFWFGPLHELNNIVPKKAKILELGSGEGIVSNFLGISEKQRKVSGLEIVSERIKEANIGIKNVSFKQGNILTSSFPKAEVIIFCHVLHHLPSYKDQLVALNRCYDQLPKNGQLVIAEVNKTVSLKYLFGWFVDVVLVPIFFEHKMVNFNVYHRSFVDWIKVLNNTGFSISKMEFTDKRPYPEVIFVAKKI